VTRRITARYAERITAHVGREQEALLCAVRGLNLVCVQPLLVWRAGEAEDLTWDKSDPKDAVVIARLAARLCCYEPERSSEQYARLRHLGARRNQLTTDARAGLQLLRDRSNACGRRYWTRPGRRSAPPRSARPSPSCSTAATAT
jgi:hypothetical protein